MRSARTIVLVRTGHRVNASAPLAMTDVDIDLLVVECIERIELEGTRALEEICTRHPDVATELRAAVEPLVGMGLVADPGRHPALPALSIPPGARIGGYEILREIGRGGMGVVFEARDEQVGRNVALKVLRESVETDSDGAQRFRREAEAAGKLRHPGLVKVHAAGLHEGQLWLAMEFIEGVGLDVVLERLRSGASGLHAAVRSASVEDPVSESEPVVLAPGEFRQRVELIMEVADALCEVQRHGIVHRDVKPSNIFVRPDGRPVLGDFGLARHVDAPEITRVGTFAGTPFYASPEQVEGRSDLGSASDVFSLGVTLYELLTLRRPFAGDSTRAVLNAIETLDPVDPGEIVVGLPEELVAITLKALAKDRRDRYPDCDSLAADLRAFLEHRPVSARRIGVAGQLRRFARREPVQATLLCVLSAAGLVLAALFGAFLAQRPLAEAGRLAREYDAGQSAITSGFQAYLRFDSKAAATAFQEAMRLLPEDELPIIGRVLSEIRFTIGADGSADAALARLETLREGRRENRVLSRLEVVLHYISRDFARVDELRKQLGPSQSANEHFLDSFLLSDDQHARKIEFLDAAIRSADRPVQIFYLFRTWQCEKHGDSLTCRSLAKTITRLWPADRSSWMAAAGAMRRFDEATALKFYRRAVALAPGELAPRVALLRFQTSRGELAAADSEAAALVEQFPGDRRVLENVAFLRREQDRVDEAIELGRRAHRMAEEQGIPASWDTTLRFVVGLLARRGDTDQAIEFLEAAIALEPRVRGYQEKRIELLLGKGDKESLQRAREVSDVLVSRFGTHSESFVSRARVHDAMGKVHAALADLRKSLEIRPDQPVLLCNLAWTLARAEQVDEALDIARRAVAVTRFGHARSLHCLGEILAVARKFEEAEKYLGIGLEVSELAPNKDVPTRKAIADLLRRLAQRPRKDPECAS